MSGPFTHLSPARRRALSGGLAALGVLALALGTFLLLRPRRPLSLAEAARRAARGAELPEALVLAVAYADTRGRASPLPARGGGLGWVRLQEASPARSLKAGAALLGVEVRRVRGDPAVGLGAAAKLLASAPGAPPASRRAEPEAWRQALRHFSGIVDPAAGALYADGVLRFWRRGFQGSDGGEPFAAAPAGGAEAAPNVPPEPSPPGLLGAAGVPFVGASAASHRPPKEPGPRRVTHVVLHTTELPFATTVAYFRSASAAVGSHYALRAQDGLALQFIDESDVAFHDACFNEASIGVEHEAMSAVGRAWLTDELYRASAALVADIASRHGIPPDREHVLGHGEAPDCSDHTDPGPDWDWGLYLRYLREAFDARGTPTAPAPQPAP